FVISDKSTLNLPMIWVHDFTAEDYSYGGVFTFYGTPDVSAHETLSDLYDTRLVLEVTLPVNGPDDRALKALVAQAEALTESDYATSAWNDMQKSLTAARTVLANANATQIMINDAVFALDRDIKALVAAGDTQTLEVMIEEFSALKSENYSAATFAILTNALDDAKALLQQGRPTQEAADQATARLVAAEAALVDVTELKAAVATAESTVEPSESYTKATYDAYAAALTAAKNAVEQATVAAEVENAKTALDIAVKALAKIGDKTGLETLLQEAKAIGEALYTPSSFHDLSTAIASAEALLASEEPSDADLEAAKAALKAAMDALQKLGDKTELNSLISTYDNETAYSASSWSEFKTALDAAKLVAGDAEASEADVATAVADLKAAAEKLVKMGDKAELAALLEQPREDASKYTAASYSAYLLAIENAQLAWADPEASEESIKTALDNLKAAIDALESVTGTETATNTDTAPTEEKGCGSVLSGAAVILTIMGLFAFAARRKEND
ncbi:MAG: FIVAR domain-containing protein, partial [Clostridia bacterium]|nr:FIVAR domain-containing protein [Clostridia bacterium]